MRESGGKASSVNSGTGSLFLEEGLLNSLTSKPVGKLIQSTSGTDGTERGLMESIAIEPSLLKAY